MEGLPSVIYFDIDDTLIPTSQIFKYCLKYSNIAVAKCLKNHLPQFRDKSVKSLLNLVVRLRDDVIKEKGSNYQFQIDDVLERLGIDYNAQVISAGVLAYHKAKFRVLKFNKEVYSFLKYASKKYRLGILSSGRTLKQWDKINIFLGFDQPFFNDKNVIISEQFNLEKKNETLFSEILEREKVAPSLAMFIGNRYDEDILPAKRLGMKAVLVNNPNSKYYIEESKILEQPLPPDLIVKDVIQLKKIL